VRSSFVRQVKPGILHNEVRRPCEHFLNHRRKSTRCTAPLSYNGLMEDTGTPLQPAKVEDILLLTEEARALPPSADQTNVLISDGADPWVLYYEGSYFYCTRNELGDRKKILVSKFDSLTDLATAPLVEVWPRAQTAIPEYLRDVI
jgi:hypothetical protein